MDSRSGAEEEGFVYEEELLKTTRGNRSPLLIFGIAIFAAAAFYLLLVVASQAGVIIPGKDLGLPLVDQLPGVDSGEIEERMNVLVMGLDRRIDDPEDWPTRTDTMFVATIDPFAKTAGVLSIPRDLWVEIPDGQGGYFSDRINVAYEYGPLKNYPGGGPGLAMATVEHNFGIEIDRYVVVDFVGFMELVDAIGGIDVEVEEYIYDPSYCLTSQCSDLEVLVFEPGVEHMDGERALAYTRVRYGSSDLRRIERQQDVLRAALDAALDRSLLLPNRAIALYDSYKKAVDTDIRVFEVRKLASLAQDIPLEDIVTVSMASAVEETVLGGAQVLLPDWDAVEELKRQVFFDGRLRSEGAVVEVQNGTGAPGLASSVASYFSEQGIPETDVAVTDATDGVYHEETIIFDLAGKEYTAKRLAEWLNLPESRVREVDGDQGLTPVPTSTADIVVVLGADAQVPEG